MSGRARSRSLREPSQRVPICHECDLCVVGGSATGVFAAVRAARLGARVAIVEQLPIFGGMAAAALVNQWHSLLDTENDRPVIAGLTSEIAARLRRRGALRDLPAPERVRHLLNPFEFSAELDSLVSEHRIRPFLSARFSLPVMEGRRIDAAIVEDKAGRRAIRARFFVDASGDGDLLRRAGFAAVRHSPLQPVSLQMVVAGLGPLLATRSDRDLWKRVRDFARERGHPDSAPWVGGFPEARGLHVVFGPRLHAVDASDPDHLTGALINGRRVARAFLAAVRHRFGRRAMGLVLAGWPMALGVRETWHARCLHRVTESELLSGKAFPDAIAHGTYPVDIHHPKGTLLRHLNGREERLPANGSTVVRRWRAQRGPTPRCYQVPFRALVPPDAPNLLVSGRLLDADRGAYGALRVQVNCNQTGEAAGVAAWLALQGNSEAGRLDPARLRRLLADGGSVMP